MWGGGGGLNVSFNEMLEEVDHFIIGDHRLAGREEWK